jgi:hypothetical protein
VLALDSRVTPICSNFKAEAIAQYVQSTAQIPLRFSRPIDKGKLAMTLATVALVVSAGWRLRSYLGVVASSSYLWAAGTIVSGVVVVPSFELTRPPELKHLHCAAAGSPSSC